MKRLQRSFKIELSFSDDMIPLVQGRQAYRMRLRDQISKQLIKGRVWWLGRTDRTRALILHIVAAINHFSRNGSSRAAALSYYAMFSLFPLTLLLAILINALVGPTVAQDQIAQGLALFLPPETVDLLRDNIVQALDQGTEFTIVALLGLVWAGSGLFTNLSAALEEIFQQPTLRNLWQQRLLAVFMAVVLLLMIGISFVASGVLRLIAALFISTPSVWVAIGIFFLPFSVNMLIFIMLFRFVPRVRVHWDAIWPSAIFGAMGWELAKGLFVWYLESFANFAVVYGSIATVIVLMLAAFLTASVVILSAELCAELNKWVAQYNVSQRRLPPVTEYRRLNPPRS